MTQSQPYTDNDERQPLLTTDIQSTMESTIEFDQQMPNTAPATSDEHNDDDAEANWVAKLQQRPWYNRPSQYWLLPWLVILGITISLSSNSIEQLKIRVVCTELLGPQGSVGIPGNFTSAIERLPSLEPVDPCRSSEVLGFVGQLNGNIGAVNGIFSKCSTVCLIICLVFLCLRSVLFINTMRCSLSLFFYPSALLTLAKWTSLSDVLGRKFLLHISMIGIAVSFLLNWFAASRFNFLGYHVYYIEAVLLGLVPSTMLVNPAVFAYTGKASDQPTHEPMLVANA